MSKIWYERKTCRLCNSEVRTVLELNPSPLANRYTREYEEQEKYPLDLRQCVSCGHVQLGQVVDPKILYSDYRYKSGVSKDFTSHLKGMAEQLSAMKKGFVVEIASNDGTLLKAFENLGHPTLGIDPAGTYNCIPELFSEQIAANFRIQVDIVVANNVLGHIDDLTDAMRGVKRILKDDGIFVFEVQYLKDLVDGNRFDLIYHEHLSYFAIKPLLSFMDDMGLPVFRVERNSSQGGSIRVFCKHYREFFYCEPEDIDVSKLRIPENPVKGLSGKVACYGSCAKTAGIIFQTGAKFDFLIDDSPEKQGMYSPAGHYVCPPNGDELRLADHVYIAAWNMADEIKKKHPNVNFINT